MIHVPDWRAGLAWYRQAFPQAEPIATESDDFGRLDHQNIAIEIVQADDKVAAGAAGSVVYWAVDDFDSKLQFLLGIGAVLYRGPLAIEGKTMICQVQDPWGNCIGLRGNAPN